MQKKPMSEHDLRMRKEIEANVHVLNELIEHNKRLLLKIDLKYEISEAQQSHNKVR